MNRVFVALMLVLLAAPASAATLKATAINDAEFPDKLQKDHKPSAAIVKLQVLLDRAQFSPGEIDGSLGENARKALLAFAQDQGLPTDQPLTPELWDKLTSLSSDPVIADYTVSAEDVKGPFPKKLPAKMEQMKSLPSLGYTSAREELAEKFHMSQQLLAALNPGKKFDRAGEVIAVANVPLHRERMNVARIEVDKRAQTVKAFDPSGRMIAFYPATVGSTEKPTPSGTLKVVSSDANPTYRYNPKYQFKGVKAREPFTIKPGPNNPVGSYWIGLSAEGYGIHGTPDPAKVSKAESHGCVRLTNWDARALGESVKRGTPVAFLDAPETPVAQQQNSGEQAGQTVGRAGDVAQ